MSRRSASAEGYEHTGRCASCYSNLDREGRVCRACLRRNGWKLGLGCVVALECAGAAWFVKNRKDGLHFDLGRQAQTAAVTNPAPAAQPQALALAATPATVVQQSQAAAALVDTMFARDRSATPASFSLGAAQGAGRATWTYSEARDDVLGDVTRRARLAASLAPVRLGRVVRNVVAATLELSRSTRYGDNVLLRLPPQRLACASNACGIRAWFDRAAPEPYGFTALPDDRQTVLAVSDTKRFASRLRAAKHVVLVASLGTSQPVTMAFDVAGYASAEAAIRQFAALVTARLREEG